MKYWMKNVVVGKMTAIAGLIGLSKLSNKTYLKNNEQKKSKHKSTLLSRERTSELQPSTV